MYIFFIILLKKLFCLKVNYFFNLIYFLTLFIFYFIYFLCYKFLNFINFRNILYENKINKK